MPQDTPAGLALEEEKQFLDFAACDDFQRRIANNSEFG